MKEWYCPHCGTSAYICKAELPLQEADITAVRPINHKYIILMGRIQIGGFQHSQQSSSTTYSTRLSLLSLSKIYRDLGRLQSGVQKAHNERQHRVEVVDDQLLQWPAGLLRIRIHQHRLHLHQYQHLLRTQGLFLCTIIPPTKHP